MHPTAPTRRRWRPLLAAGLALLTTACLPLAAPVVMTASAAATTTTIATYVATASAWHYLDTGVAPASTWATVGFNDGAWRTGTAQLGAGDGDERTRINRLSPAHRIDWFRQSFSVASPSAVTSLSLGLVADDSAYVYLNGTRVLNDNVAANGYPVVPRTGAEENRVRTFALPVSALRAGTNVLAVELRQDWTSDPDSSFSASLTGKVTTTVTSTVSSTTTTAAAPTTTVAPTTTTTVAPTTTTTVAPTTTVPPAVLPVGPTNFRTLRFADEFNGTSLDTTRWSPYNNTYGSGNHELECNSPANATVSGGSLRIVSRRETVTCGDGKVMNYTSAFLGSREAGRYYPREAYFELRAKVPHAQGIWPAFWLRHSSGSSTAEVDVMEYFHSQVPGRITQTLHLNGVSNVFKRVSAIETPTATPGWHTFGVAIEAVTGGERFTLYLDGTATGTYTDTNAAWASTGNPDAMFDIAINQAVGGNWVGDPDGTLGELPLVGRCSISGTYPGGCATTGIRRWSGAETYEVDYVRVFTH